MLGLGEALEDFFNWLLKSVAERALDMLDWITAKIAGLVPSGLQEAVNAFADTYATANKWLPLDFAIDLVIAYIATYVFCMAIRFIWKVIR